MGSGQQRKNGRRGRIIVSNHPALIMSAGAADHARSSRGDRDVSCVCR